MGAGLLDGKVALVTGAANGLGLGIAHRLVEEGATGIGLDLVEPSEPPHASWRSLHCDVSNEAALAGAFELVAREFGRLDIVVANAGLVPPWRETAEIDLEEWDRVFAVNVRGVAATIKQAVPLMKAGGGSIIVTGSLNSLRGDPRQCLYVATKHAVLGIVRSTALDLGRYGIRVNALAPGPIATEALVGRIRSRAAAGGPPLQEAFDAFAAGAALGRMATIEDVASAALYLASPLSAGMTGQVMPIDAGL